MGPVLACRCHGERKRSALQETISTIRAKTWGKINQAILASATQRRIEALSPTGGGNRGVSVRRWALWARRSGMAAAGLGAPTASPSLLGRELAGDDGQSAAATCAMSISQRTKTRRRPLTIQGPAAGDIRQEARPRLPMYRSDDNAGPRRAGSANCFQGHLPARQSGQAGRCRQTHP